MLFKAKEMLIKAKEWAVARFGEVSTWDGVSLMLLSGAVYLSAPFVEWLAAAAFIYGAYRFMKAEGKI